MIYRLIYEKTTAKMNILQNVLLLIAVILDIFAIVFIVQAVLANAFYAFGVVGLFCVSFAVRFIALKLCFKVEYRLENNHFIVSKNYILGKKVVIDNDLKEISVKNLQNNAKITNCIDLSDEFNDKFLVEINDKKYVCNMDKYMFATLLEGKEL